MCTCHACSYNTRDILIGYITSYGNGFIEGSVDIFGHMDFFLFHACYNVVRNNCYLCLPPTGYPRHEEHCGGRSCHVSGR